VAFLATMCIFSGGLQVLIFEMLAEVAYPVREIFAFGLLNSLAEFFMNMIEKVTLLADRAYYFNNLFIAIETVSIFFIILI